MGAMGCDASLSGFDDLLVCLQKIEKVADEIL